jgi:hypothetical protein
MIMSMTQLVYDTGTIVVPPGLGLKQIGPTLDVRRFSKIRIVAHEVPPVPPGDIFIDLFVREGSVVMPLAVELAFTGALPDTRVIDVPGREVEVFVRDIPAPTPRRLHLLIFGLES